MLVLRLPWAGRTYTALGRHRSMSNRIQYSNFLSVMIDQFLYPSISLSLPISVYLYLSLPISIYLYLSLSVSIYLYLSLSVSIYLYLSLSISIYLYLSLSISIYLYLSLSISICPYLSLSVIYPSIRPSVSPFSMPPRHPLVQLRKLVPVGTKNPGGLGELTSTTNDSDNWTITATAAAAAAAAAAAS